MPRTISPPQAKISEDLVAGLGSNLAIKEHEQSSTLAQIGSFRSWNWTEGSSHGQKIYTVLKAS